jgi:acetyltransferase-like isoleucine patch superfamily enzyme
MGTLTAKAYAAASYATTVLGSRRLRSAGVDVAGVVLQGHPIVSLTPGSVVRIGTGVVLCSWSHMTALGVSHPVVLRTLTRAASLIIGDDTGISGSTICVAHSVIVGRRCLLGADSMIMDTSFHPVDDWEGRRTAPLPVPCVADEVIIGDDVFIGARAVVLPGTRVGSGSVVGAGAVIKGEFPERVLIAGNPGRVVRVLIPNSDEASVP